MPVLGLDFKSGDRPGSADARIVVVEAGIGADGQTMLTDKASSYRLFELEVRILKEQLDTLLAEAQRAFQADDRRVKSGDSSK